MPRNVAGLLTVTEADYRMARGDAAAAERVIGAADPAGPYGCVLLARLVELLLDHGRAAEAAAALDRLSEVAGGRFAPWSRVSLLGAKVPRARMRSAGLLTETEERIARLVRQGMRNREIAAALHYTPRSVEMYLSRIYAKLRISSRLELARLLDTTDRLS